MLERVIPYVLIPILEFIGKANVISGSITNEPANADDFVEFIVHAADRSFDTYLYLSG